ncbi:hypothetical protein Syn7502_00674 [Synechococcus sp. PCC 7502]|uniref:DUF4336 domain-containing protein n=1 Tax=Synechococcus sp. PCC 7502 TaxID=1173263 RepID=UPI00029F8906|nr:DUF4336 domain-containing protein [Synechococcus sp. PCC 7502]AFY72822.1 hypothetical protein Syn7502_00674 [Synechococcus sp. PCC 7502]
MEQDWRWDFWYPLPLYPYNLRRTVRTEIVKDQIWAFDQLQGIFYVVVPIRMTVVKLEAGGLVVYAPIAPTAECLKLLRELTTVHGEVKYIILPTASGLEHKVYVAPFARHFQQAQVYVSPSQWSYPLNLPLSWLGFPRDRTHILPQDSSQTPFASEFDYAILEPINLGLGTFEEVAFYHRRSQTLLVTDIVLSIPDSPPAITQLDPYPLLFHAKEDAAHNPEDTPANRIKGWQRIVLFTFYFKPHALETLSLGAAWQNSFGAKERSPKTYFGLYPFQWQDHWRASFENLCRHGQLLVAPILQTLILKRSPQKVRYWVEKVSRWQFTRIVPCHFQAEIKATPAEFKQAFVFLDDQVPNPLPDQDFQLLKAIEHNLIKLKILPK